MLRIFPRLLLALMSWLAVCGPTLANDYPNRTIRIVLGLAAGGGGDAFARVLSEELRKSLGVPVVVENRPGGNETIGARVCADAEPDGYTVCLLSSEPTTYHQFLYKNNKFDGARELDTVVTLFLNTFGLAVSSKLNVSSLDDLVALSKAKPGTLSYGTFFFPLTRFIDKLNSDKGTDIVRVPFRGGADLANAMLAGSTPIGLFGLSNMLAQINGGLFTLIGVNSESRSPLYPNVPTFVELNRGLSPSTWFGIFSPKRMPRPIMEKLGDEIERIVRQPEFRQRMYVARGIEPFNLKYEAMMEYLKKDIAAASTIMKEAGYEPQ